MCRGIRGLKGRLFVNSTVCGTEFNGMREDMEVDEPKLDSGKSLGSGGAEAGEGHQAHHYCQK